MVLSQEVENFNDAWKLYILGPLYHETCAAFLTAILMDVK
jgi:hypothetical protein